VDVVWCLGEMGEHLVSMCSGTCQRMVFLREWDSGNGAGCVTLGVKNNGLEGCTCTDTLGRDSCSRLSQHSQWTAHSTSFRLDSRNRVVSEPSL
jgi:hypothetical protein